MDLARFFEEQKTAQAAAPSTPSILFVSHESSRTGAPIFLLRFLGWLKQRCETPFRILVGSQGSLFQDFAALAPTDSFEPLLSLSYRTLRKFNLHGSLATAHVAALKEKLLAAKIGLIYSNTFVNGSVLNFLSFLNCPVLCHVHELERAILHFGAENEMLVKKYSSSYIAVSGAVRQNLISNHGIPAEAVNVVHGFIPVVESSEAFAVESRVAVREELRVRPDCKLICGCGSIEPRKGIDEFLFVAQKVLKDSHEDVHFFWVGGASGKVQNASRQAVAMGIEDRVHFLGSRSDVNKYYAGSDIFFLSSIEDPFPLVMMEAALHALPVACFQGSGGAPEFVADDAGVIAPDFDLDAMAQKIIHLLASPTLRRSLGCAGRQKVLDQFNLDVGSEKILSIIRRSLQATPRGNSY